MTFLFLAMLSFEVWAQSPNSDDDGGDKTPSESTSDTPSDSESPIPSDKDGRPEEVESLIKSGVFIGSAPNKKASGDIYDTLANSLNFALLDEDNRGQNRFLRYVAGSYDKSDGSQVNQFSGITGAFQNEPTGVYGSRQKKSGKSLTEMYRRGRRASVVSRRTVISENAKRLKGRFR